MRSNLLFLIGTLVFLAIVWTASGGYEKAVALLHPTDGTPSSTVTKTALGSGDTTSRPSSMASAGLASADATLIALQKQLRDLHAFENPSPYRGLVTIEHNTAGVLETDVQKQYLTLSVSTRAREDISLSGWKLVSSATGLSATISEGTETARSGAVNTEAPIQLHPGDTAVIITGASPIGVSFRENSCSGYLGQFQSFSPTLSQSCPLPTEEVANLHDSSCSAYAKSFPRCTLAVDVPGSLSGACQTALTSHLNYNGCVEIHQNDKDFSSAAWRIFLGSTKSLWNSSRETIKLLDADGKTVDVFAY